MSELTPKQIKRLRKAHDIIMSGDTGAIAEYLYDVEESIDALESNFEKRINDLEVENEEEFSAVREKEIKELRDSFQKQIDDLKDIAIPKLEGIFEKIKGEKGDSFRYEDFTAYQIESLKIKGDDGKTPVKGRDYFDGYTPVKGKDYFDGEPGEPGEDADVDTIVTKVAEMLPVLGKPIRDALELLPAEDEAGVDQRLDKSAIKGWEEFEKEIRALANARRGGGAGPGSRTVQVADLTAQCDGITKTFEVPMHTFAVSLQGTQFPIVYRPGIDFTTANKVLTLGADVSAPETSQTLIFLYIK